MGRITGYSFVPVTLAVIFAFSEGLLVDNVDLTKQRLDDLEKRIQILEQAVRKDNVTVVFVAELTNDVVNPPNNFHIVFDSAVLNLGNAYNQRHGVFTAPLRGVYHFAVEITAPYQSSDHTMHILIMKRNNPVAITFVDSNTHQFLRRTGSILLELEVGDDIWCKTNYISGLNTISSGNKYSMFSGFLLKAL